MDQTGRRIVAETVGAKGQPMEFGLAVFLFVGAMDEPVYQATLLMKDIEGLDQEDREARFELLLRDAFDNARVPACVDPQTPLIFPPGQDRETVMKGAILACGFQYSKIVAPT